MKIYILCVIFVLTNLICFGQTSKFSVGLGTYGFNLLESKKFDRFGGSLNNIYTTKELNLSYKISKKNKIGVSFSFWNNALSSESKLNDIVAINIKGHDTLATVPFTRTKYKYLDVYGIFEAWSFKKNILQLTLGLTYANGNNSYLRKLVLSPDPNFIDIIYAGFEYKKENYYGLVCGFGYRYNLFKNRISIGINSNLRLYSQYPVHISYGIVANYNF